MRMLCRTQKAAHTTRRNAALLFVRAGLGRGRGGREGVTGRRNGRSEGVGWKGLGSGVKWTNLNPQKILDNMEEYERYKTFFPFSSFDDFMKRCEEQRAGQVTRESQSDLAFVGGRTAPPFLHAPRCTFSNYLGHLALLRAASGPLVALAGWARCVGHSSSGGGVKIVQGRGRAGRGGPDAGALRFYRLRGEEAASRITGQPARAAHASCLIASGSEASLGGTAEAGPWAAQLRTQGLRDHWGGGGAGAVLSQAADWLGRHGDLPRLVT
ncbi:hypothetical protein E2C01_040633 [Portunus trituberculatus]|uniref:Uncharacterized protein n=1 Tax=Portunus trituberculatus TaxID=210409 RepID=A0A5B7FKB2_PORTR|nr:hypothetical protein [Portunus trituberculatus]